MILIWSYETPVGKVNLYGSISLSQSDNETMESDSATLFSSNLNVESKYFGGELKSPLISNINSIITNSTRTKLDDLVKGVRGSKDILMISETKLDVSFLTSEEFI